MLSKVIKEPSKFFYGIFNKEFLIINSGIFLNAVGIVLFRNPNRFASGGVSGLALLFTSFIPLPVGAIALTLNALILVLGVLFLGKENGMRCIYGTFALSGMMWLLEVLFPMSEPLTDQRFLELIYSVFIPGVGTALVLHYRSTTGGTTILAQILSKYLKWKISVSLMAVDLFIAISAGFLFGVEAALFSILAVGLRSLLLDNVLESLKIYKIVVIISDKSEAIQNYICHALRRGATVHLAQGAYSVQHKEVITTVLSRRQAFQLQQFIKEVDPAAFITISNSTQIIGNGFEGF